MAKHVEAVLPAAQEVADKHTHTELICYKHSHYFNFLAMSSSFRHDSLC